MADSGKVVKIGSRKSQVCGYHENSFCGKIVCDEMISAATTPNHHKRRVDHDLPQGTEESSLTFEAIL